MPASRPNVTGSPNPAEVPYGPWSSFPWAEYPEWEGTKSIIYRSPDGKRVAGAIRQTASATFTYTYDEFVYVLKGWLEVKIHGGESFVLHSGDCVYFCKGQTADFASSEDFTNLSVFIDDVEPIANV